MKKKIGKTKESQLEIKKEKGKKRKKIEERRR